MIEVKKKKGDTPIWIINLLGVSRDVTSPECSQQENPVEEAVCNQEMKYQLK